MRNLLSSFSDPPQATHELGRGHLGRLVLVDESDSMPEEINPRTCPKRAQPPRARGRLDEERPVNLSFPNPSLRHPFVPVEPLGATPNSPRRSLCARYHEYREPSLEPSFRTCEVSPFPLFEPMDNPQRDSPRWNIWNGNRKDRGLHYTLLTCALHPTSPFVGSAPAGLQPGLTVPQTPRIAPRDGWTSESENGLRNSHKC